MPDFQPTLLSAELSYNYVEHGDTLYITTRWQNTGSARCTRDVTITANMVFDMDQRHLENLGDGFSVSWTPAPAVYEWKPGEIWATTGAWKVPQTWCGFFRVFVSLTAENGEKLPFIGKNGELVFKQEFTDVDLGWGWGRMMLEATRQPVCVEINAPKPMAVAENQTQDIKLGEFTLCQEYPALTGAGIWSWPAREPVVIARNRETNDSIRCISTETRPAYALVSAGEGKVRYRAEGFFGSFDIVFSMEEKLCIYLDNVSETTPYEIIGIHFPAMAGTDEDGTLVNFFCGGREVSVRDTYPMTAAFPYDICNAVAACGGGQALSVITENYEALLHQGVEEDESARHGVIGVSLFHRVKADKPGLASIPAGNKPVELFLDKGDSWQVLANLLRSRLPEGRTGLYDNTLFYKIVVDSVMQSNGRIPDSLTPPMNIEEVKRIIHGIYNITNGMRQVLYLVGWQENGHDTLYPNPHQSKLSPRFGDEGSWEELRLFAKQYNAILSLHDNFDDAYMPENYAKQLRALASFPDVHDNEHLADFARQKNVGEVSASVDGAILELDKNLLAADKRGEYQRGWLWAGGMTYIMSPKAYVESGEAAARIDKTLSRFSIEESYHIDVLTSEVRRYDFTPGRQTAADENVEYKRGMIRRFNKHGVDITSEALALPFIGYIGYALHTRYNVNETLFYGEKVIPLTTMVFHGNTPYNMGSCSDESLLYALAYGATGGLDDAASGTKTALARSLYLHSLPMQRLMNCKVEGCEEQDGALTVFYENDSRVTVDFERKSYEIVIEGKRVGWDYNTVLPSCGGNEIYAFSKDGGAMDIETPPDWMTAAACTMSFEGRGEAMRLSVKNGRVQIVLEPDVPVLITHPQE